MEWWAGACNGGARRTYSPWRRVEPAETIMKKRTVALTTSLVAGLVWPALGQRGRAPKPSAMSQTVRELARGSLAALEQSGMVPVIAPIGVGAEGETYNINADTVAGAVAAAVGAARLLMLTDVIGVLDKSGDLLTDLTVEDVAKLEADGTVSGGMIPKLQTCVEAVQGGVEASVILDGRVPHALLLEIFTDKGLGTLVRR